MDEKRPISKNVLFDIFKNQNEAALRSPTPSHLLNRSGKNSAFKTPPLGSTPVNYNIPLHPKTEHLFLNQTFYNTADNYGPEENFSSSVVTANLSPSSVYLPHSRNLGRGSTETTSTIIPGNSLQNPLSFNSFQHNLSPTIGTSLGGSRERIEDQPKHPIRPLPTRGISSQLHYTLDSLSVDLGPSIINDNCISEKIDNTLSIKDNNNSTRQGEEINLNNEDVKIIDNKHELLDKDRQLIRETESNQVEQAPDDDDSRLELIKWHLKVISIKDTFVPEVKIPEGVDFWVVLSGIVRGTRDKWHSDVITAIVHNRLVQTAKDKSYLLVGKLSSKKMKADGFSEGLIKAFEDGFPENWQELLFADLRSSSFSFKESHEKSPLEKRINSGQEGKNSPNKKRFKAPTVQKQGKIVTSSGRHIRAPGNWWEVNPKPNMKEEIVEPKRQRLSSTRKRISGRSQKRQSSQKGNITGNVREASEDTKVNVPRHEVYVLVETSRSK